MRKQYMQPTGKGPELSSEKPFENNFTFQPDHLTFLEKGKTEVRQLLYTAVAGLIVSYMKKTLWVCNQVNGIPTVWAEIADCDRLTFIKQLSFHVKALPIWFIQRKSVKNFFPKKADQAKICFEASEKNGIYAEATQEQAESKKVAYAQPSQKLMVNRLRMQIVTNFEADNVNFPVFYDKIDYTHNNNGIKRSELRPMERAWVQGKWFEGRIFERGTDLYLLYSFEKSTKFWEHCVECLNQWRQQGTVTGILPIHYVFSEGNKTYVALHMQGKEISVLEWLRDRKPLEQTTPEQWEQQVRKIAQHLFSTVTALHNDKVSHANIHLETLAYTPTEVKLVMTQTTRQFSETQSTLGVADTGEDKDWHQYARVVGCLLRRDTDEQNTIIPASGLTQQALNFLRLLTIEDAGVRASKIKSFKWQ